jgi:hypothetical protein
MFGMQLFASAYRPDAGPNFATIGNEVVVWIDHQERSDVLVVCRDIHGFLLWRLDGAIC